MDGLDVLRALRGWTQVPVIVLSARHLEASKVDALDEGADDYVTKPFGMDELLARLRAVQRRGRRSTRRRRRDGRLHDRPRGQAGPPPAGRRCTSPRRSGSSWSSWCGTPGKLVSQRQVLQEVWGPQYETRDRLPPRVHRGGAAQARARAQPPALLHHRAGDGLPVRARPLSRLRNLPGAAPVRRAATRAGSSPCTTTTPTTISTTAASPSTSPPSAPAARPPSTGATR